MGLHSGAPDSGETRDNAINPTRPYGIATGDLRATRAAPSGQILSAAFCVLR